MEPGVEDGSIRNQAGGLTGTRPRSQSFTSICGHASTSPWTHQDISTTPRPAAGARPEAIATDERHQSQTTLSKLRVTMRHRVTASRLIVILAANLP